MEKKNHSPPRQTRKGIDRGSTPKAPRYPDTSATNTNQNHMMPAAPPVLVEDTTMPSVGSYREYPSVHPFINNPYSRDAAKPVNAFPESNSEAVKSALLNLQKKIRQLEKERGRAKESCTQAEESFRSVSSETAGFTAFRKERAVSPSFKSTDTKDLEIQLSAAESRSQLLEKQLEYMRRMVTAAEKERTDTVRRSALLQQRHFDLDDEDLRHKIEKVQHLEKDHLRLEATQTMAAAKIRELESKLKEEEHRRRLMQERAAEMETQAEANRILLEVASDTAIPRKVVRKKKKVPTATLR